MSTLLRLLVLAPLVGALAPSAAARQDDLVSELLHLREGLVADLAALAEWCQGERLYLGRDQAYEALLGYAPDHEEARETLGWRRDRTGEWVRRGTKRTPRNRNADSLPDLERRREELVTRWVRAHVAVLEEHDAPVGRRRGALEPLLPLDPDHPGLRGALGQVRVEGDPPRWVRRSAATALARRAERASLLETLRGFQLDAETWEPGPPADDLGIAWTAGFEQPNVRLAGTVPAEEARRIVDAIDVVYGYLPAVVPPPGEDDGSERERGRTLAEKRRAARRRGHAPVDDDVAIVRESGWWRLPMEVYVVRDAAERSRLVDGWPDLSPGERELMERLVTGWLDESLTLGVWSDDPDLRLEAPLRQRVGVYLKGVFGITTKVGWVWEGLGLNLSYPVCGTRKMLFVREDPYLDGQGRPDFDFDLLASNADWLAYARERIEDPRPVRLQYTLGRDVNDMTREDLVLAYALGQYLLDGRPELVTPVLLRIGAGEASLEVLESELGLRLPEIVEELHGWLVDVGA